MPSECERHGGQLSQARALHQQVSAGEGGAQPWPDETPPPNSQPRQRGTKRLTVIQGPEGNGRHILKPSPVPPSQQASPQ